VRTARAKGVTPAGLVQHVLRKRWCLYYNVSMAIPFLFTGFVWRVSRDTRFGCISLNAINSSYMDVVRAVVQIGALVYSRSIWLRPVLCVVDPRNGWSDGVIAICDG
jgi:ABC-type dipeptide/oligopeptide/nickel transport system permease component